MAWVCDSINDQDNAGPRLKGDCGLIDSQTLALKNEEVGMVARVSTAPPTPVAAKPAAAAVNGQTEVYYPESDGKPMADNTRQFRYIVTIHSGIADLFAGDPNVFVAGDLLWYPVEGSNTIRVAPDVLVVFGRPPGDRGSYLQWKEENIPPQVVFEVLSPGNTFTEMTNKLRFYERYGVEEYYLYDPDNGELSGWLRSERGLEEIPEMEGWVSPRLGIRFGLDGRDLTLFRPDGTRFETYTEVRSQLAMERQRAEEERQRADRLAERLRALGVDPENA